jgi:anti-sigma factor RsiW
MLRCRDIAEQASDYVDGQLSWRRQLAVRLHLVMCLFCRRYTRQMRSTVTLLQGLRSKGVGSSPDEEPPSDADIQQILERAR